MSTLQPSATILVKLGSIAVHVEEMFSVKGHYFDKVALQTLLADEEIKTWLKEMSTLALLPVKR